MILKSVYYLILYILSIHCSIVFGFEERKLNNIDLEQEAFQFLKPSSNFQKPRFKLNHIVQHGYVNIDPLGYKQTFLKNEQSSAHKIPFFKSLKIDNHMNINDIDEFTSDNVLKAIIPGMKLKQGISTQSNGAIHSKMIPDYTDASTVLAISLMCANSYLEPGSPNWRDVPGWESNTRFGWPNTGIRGYIFEDESAEYVMIVLKGTSLATPVGSGPSAPSDRYNDNILFSCCCAKAGWSWTPICDCVEDSSHCNTECIRSVSTKFNDSYYNIANKIYDVVKTWYPDTTTFWLAGHSLGGALASLTALTKNIPAFTYEAPGEYRFAKLIGLLDGKENNMDKFDIYHFGNLQDPIYWGQCNGITSSCWWFDYALETGCHTGAECVYDFKNGPDVQPPPPTDSNGNPISTTSILNSYPTEEALQIETDNHEIEVLRKYSSLLQKLDASKMSTSMFSVSKHTINYVINKITSWTMVPKCYIRHNCTSTECVGWSYV